MVLKRTSTLPGWVSFPGRQPLHFSSWHYFDSWQDRVVQKCLPNTPIVGGRSHRVVCCHFQLQSESGSWQVDLSDVTITPHLFDRHPKQRAAVTQSRVDLWRGCAQCNDGRKIFYICKYLNYNRHTEPGSANVDKGGGAWLIKKQTFLCSLLKFCSQNIEIV